MIKGKNLMVALNTANGYHTIALATSCSLDASTNLSDALTKDDDESAPMQEATGMSWTLKSDNMVPVKSNGKADFYTLTDMMLNRNIVKLRFSLYEGAAGKSVDGLADGNTWTGKAGVNARVIFEGEAIIESLELNAPNKENATMSVSFKGKGRPVFANVPTDETWAETREQEQSVGGDE